MVLDTRFYPDLFIVNALQNTMVSKMFQHTIPTYKGTLIYMYVTDGIH